MPRLLVEADYHAHHRAGLNAPDWWMPATGVYAKWGRAQREMWNKRAELLEKIGPVDAWLGNGDLFDGRGERSGGTELLPDAGWPNQIANAEASARLVQFRGEPKRIMSRGTPAHVGWDADYEDVLALNLHATIKDHPFFTLGGVTFDAKHKVGSSSIPHGRGTAISRERLWNVLWAEHGEQPKAQVLLRCLSEDTEILTRGGWRGRNDILMNQDVLTLNLETNLLEWKPVLDITEHGTDKEMVSFHGKGVDILVSPDHTMLAQTNFWPTRQRDLRRLPASDLVGRSRFGLLVSGNLADQSGVPVSDAMLEVLAWVIAEGNLSAGNASAGYPEVNNVRIFQREERSHRIEDALHRAGLPFTRHVRDNAGQEIRDDSGRTYYTKSNTVVLYIRQPFGKQIVSTLGGEKNIPDWLMAMNDRQFEIFLDAYVSGDGYLEPGTKRKQGKIFTANKDLADRLQALLVVHGYKSSIASRPKWGKITYSVSFVRKVDVLVGQGKNHAAVVPYSGNTWCVKTENGTIVTRRNGCVAILGNSHVHYHYFVGEPGWVAMTTAGLQAAGTKFGGRQCSGTVHWGVTVFDCEGGEFDWKTYVCRLSSNKVAAIQL
jgi:hypothetical protein